MVWKAQLVSVDGHAMVRRVWIPEADAPKTLQEMCLMGPANPLPNAKDKGTNARGRTIYNVSKPPAPTQPLPDAVYNPITADYSYMRYAMCLGAGGDVCGWDESDRPPLPDLVHSRESSPASSSSGSSMSFGSPSSSIGESFGRFTSSLPSSQSHCPTSSSSSQSAQRWEDDGMHDISMADPRLADFTHESIHFPTQRIPPEDEISFQLAELRESFINPFTNTEYYRDV